MRMPTRQTVRRRQKAVDLTSPALSQSGILSRGTLAPAADCPSAGTAALAVGAGVALVAEPAAGLGVRLGAGLIGSAALGAVLVAGAARDPRRLRGNRGSVFRLRLAFPARRLRRLIRFFPARWTFRMVLARGFLLFRPLLIIGFRRWPHRMAGRFGLSRFGLLGPGVLCVRLLLRRRFGAAGAEDISGKRRGFDRCSPYNARAKKPKASGYFYRRPSLAGSCGTLHNPLSRSRPVTCPGRY